MRILLPWYEIKTKMKKKIR